MRPISRARPWMTTAGLLGVGIWSFLFVALFGTALPDFDVRVRTAAQLLYVVPLAVWAVFRLRGPRDIVDIAVLAAIGSALVVSAASLDRLASLEALGIVVAFALLFWLMRDIASRPRMRGAISVGVTGTITAWLVLAGATWIGHKLQWIVAGGGVPPLSSGPIPGWSSANTFPFLILAGLPFVAELPPGRVRWALTVVYVSASAVVIPLSGGLAGFIGLAVCLVVYGIFTARLKRRHARIPARQAIVAAGGLAVVGLATAMLLGPARLAAMVDGALSTRLRLWEQAISIWQAHPLTGGGPATFHWLRLEHSPDHVDRVPVSLAHNVVMQTAADGGFVLLVGLALPIVAILFSVASDWPIGRSRRLMLAALVGYAAASMLDDMSILPALTAMVVTTAAWLAGPPRERGSHRGFALPALVGVIALCALPGVISIAAARAQADAARADALQGNWAAAGSHLNNAIESHPDNGGYWLARGLALSRVGDIDGAVEAYRRAAEVASGDPRSYGALGSLDPDHQAAWLSEAARRTTRDPQYAYRLGAALLEAQESDATTAFARAVIIDTRLLGVLPGGANRVEIAQVALQRVEDERLNPEIAFDIALALASDLSHADPAWRAVRAAQDGDPALARQLIGEAQRSAPYHSRTHQAAAYVAEHSCNAEGKEDAELLASLLPTRSQAPYAVVERWDFVYREEGLGDYQPVRADQPPDVPTWPLPLVPAPPACP